MTQAAQAAFHRRQITNPKRITAGTVQRHQREASPGLQPTASHRHGLIDAHSLFTALTDKRPAEVIQSRKNENKPF